MYPGNIQVLYIYSNVVPSRFDLDLDVLVSILDHSVAVTLLSLITKIEFTLISKYSLSQSAYFQIFS